MLSLDQENTLFDRPGNIDPNEDFVDFTIGAPGADLLQEVTKLALAASQEALSAPDAHFLLQYGAAKGLGSFRKELARWLEHEYQESSIDPSRLTVTSGATQSFTNIVTLFTCPDTVFLIEDPTYFLALDLVREQRKDSTILPVPTDESGIILENLEDLLKKHSPKEKNIWPNRFPFMLYLVPTHNNPTGRSLTHERRVELVKLAAKYNVLVVCDDVYDILRYEDRADAPKRLVAYDYEINKEAAGTVISNGTFSKLFGPGIRLGWIEAKEDLINAISESGLNNSGGSPNQFASGIMTQLLASGKLSSFVDGLRDIYSSRLKALMSVLTTQLPSSCQVLHPKGGYFVWILLPKHVNTRELLTRCREETHVIFSPGDRFSLAGQTNHCLRLCFAYNPEKRITDGAQRLCQFLASQLK
ncbi:PLP-dependent transferase [Basidiobolus meristosporus CBS 931.73]|uniref:PLP-dependent transferase n=1 Tax=Basidiobolus meristosporus CBS 931.73 TaxID=1314790 RepID=A0A1Y1YT61_9FUNG|nr:PLP-dependent transferase [Basidiobolus meristosporus CBS 931.73]|eukprot:ORY01233.1 PLP-dependent transferase [Basidiobolus meristosporus CBS 931.73]